MSLLQVTLVVFIINLIATSETQPVIAGSNGIPHGERRHLTTTVASPSSSSRPCNYDSGHTSTSDVSLWYKNGWFLAIHDNGNINGTSGARNLDIKLQLRSVGSSLVRIYSPQHCLYVAMASSGKVYATEQPTEDTVFKQTHEPTGFYTFASFKHFAVRNNQRELYFLSMRKTGHMKNGKKTSRHHRTTLLSVITARETF